MPADILDLIDHAIEGATSDDAMRWTPEAKTVATQDGAGWVDLGYTTDGGVFTREDAARVFDVPVAMIGPRPMPASLTPAQQRAIVEAFEVHVLAPARAAIRAIGTAVGQAVAPMVAAAEAAREAGLVPEEPPPDPMARALWLRQHRNTGPAVRQRAPRRIDPGRSR